MFFKKLYMISKKYLLKYVLIAPFNFYDELLITKLEVTFLKKALHDQYIFNFKVLDVISY